MKILVGISISLTAFLCLALLPANQSIEFGKVPVQTCLTNGCHIDQKIFQDYADSFSSGIHARRGMTCNDCHKMTYEHILDGDPGPEDRAPYPWEEPEFCGSCHSDALMMKRFNAAPDITAEQIYWTSHHGEAMETLKSFADSGRATQESAAEIGKNLATCSSCHGTHGIMEIASPRSQVFPQNVAATCGQCHGDVEKIRSYSEAIAAIDPSLAKKDQTIKLLGTAYQDYGHKENIHREALVDRGMLDAPTCNDCHGNHGATPPGAFGATRVAEVCGSCHIQNYTNFKESPKAEIFGNSFDRDCYACHSNHIIHKASDSMIGLTENTVCFECHQDPDLYGAEIIQGIRDEIDSLKAARDEAKEILDKAENMGMGVDDGYEKLVLLNTALITARGKVHTYALEPVQEATAPGLVLAKEAKLIGEDALDEVDFRRWGLAASSLMILFLAFIIFLKIRQIER